MGPALQTTTTDADGQFQFPPRQEDASYYVVIRKAPFAPIEQIVSSEGPIQAALRPAVDTWIEVRSAAGKFLKGARVTSISIRTQENTEAYLWRGMEQLLGMEFNPSDDAGSLGPHSCDTTSSWTCPLLTWLVLQLQIRTTCPRFFNEARISRMNRNLTLGVTGSRMPVWRIWRS